MLVAVVALVVGGVVLGARRDIAPERSTDLEQLGWYGDVPSFVLTERSGRRVTTADLRGSVWVVDFIYTECTESCPTQSLQLAPAPAGVLRYAGSPPGLDHRRPCARCAEGPASVRRTVRRQRAMVVSHRRQAGDLLPGARGVPPGCH